jgi:predicted PurR-regulated permease PerM
VISRILATLAGSAWARAALRYGVTALAILLFLLVLRRSGERVGRLTERLDTREKANEVQRRMLEAAARRPRSRDDLVERLRDGKF